MFEIEKPKRGESGTHSELKSCLRVLFVLAMLPATTVIVYLLLCRFVLELLIALR
jgi:hypothetical protein